MNKKNIIILVISFLILFTACNKKIEQNNEINKEKKFKENVQSIIDIIKTENEEYIQQFGKIYYSYGIDNGYLNSIFGNSHDIKDFNINKAFIFVNADSKIYLSLETDEYCAIKDFNDSDFSIYSIDEKNQCHKFNIIEGNLSLSILASKLNSKGMYQFNTISDEYVSLLASTNLVDADAVQYKWYRNDELIENANSYQYVVTNDNEDAEYFAEIITPNGDKIFSNVVNVKINLQ